jgi:hypothetical protein
MENRIRSSKIVIFLVFMSNNKFLIKSEITSKFDKFKPKTTEDCYFELSILLHSGNYLILYETNFASLYYGKDI